MKPFPYAIDVKDLLSMLGGTSVTIKPAKQGFQSLKYPAFAGLFSEDGATEACATVIADFNASMSIAGAFMRIPPSAVLEDLRSQACGEAAQFTRTGSLGADRAYPARMLWRQDRRHPERADQRGAGAVYVDRRSADRQYQRDDGTGRGARQAHHPRVPAGMQERRNAESGRRVCGLAAEGSCAG